MIKKRRALILEALRQERVWCVLETEKSMRIQQKVRLLK